MNFPSPNQQQEKIFLRSQQTNSNSHSHSESGTRGREKKKARISIDSGFDEREEGDLGGGGENKENESGLGLGGEVEGDEEGPGEGMDVEEVPESENGDHVGERITQVGSIGMGMGERRSGIGDPPVTVENGGVDQVVRFLTFLRTRFKQGS